MLNKIMTTKFPLGVVLMELACQLGLRRACLHARCLPRLQNEEADALTNGEFHHFDMNKRVSVDLEKLEFRVMNELFAEGESYVEELGRKRSGEHLARRLQKERPGRRAPVFVSVNRGARCFVLSPLYALVG